MDHLQGAIPYGDVPVQIEELKLPAQRMPKEIFYLPAFFVLFIIIVLQRRRQIEPAF